MTSSIIDRARDLVEVTTGLGRIGASIAWDRVRTAAGIPRLRDCDACGGVAYELRTVDGRTACISCVETEREDADSEAYVSRSVIKGLQSDLLKLRRREPMQHEVDLAACDAAEVFFEGRTCRRCRVCGHWAFGGATACDLCVAREDLAAANARTDKAETALADLTKIHDEALAALSVAIQRAEKAEAERDRTAKADREELRAWVESAAEKTRECEVMMAERNEYYTELAELRVNVMRLAKALWQRVRTDDHACGRCVEGGPIVRDGFVCAHHLAEDYLAIERERSAAAEVKS